MIQNNIERHPQGSHLILLFLAKNGESNQELLDEQFKLLDIVYTTEDFEIIEIPPKETKIPKDHNQIIAYINRCLGGWGYEIAQVIRNLKKQKQIAEQEVANKKIRKYRVIVHNAPVDDDGVCAEIEVELGKVEVVDWEIEKEINYQEVVSGKWMPQRNSYVTVHYKD